MITKAAHGHTSEKGTGRARSMKLLCSSSHSIAVSVVFNRSTAAAPWPAISLVISPRQPEPNSPNNDRFASIDRGDRGERAARRQGHHEALARGRAIWGSLRRGYADARATGPARRPDRGGRPDRRRRRGERRATHSGQAPPERIRKFIHWPRAGRGLCCGACRRSGPIPMAIFPPDLTSCLPHLARASG